MLLGCGSGEVGDRDRATAPLEPARRDSAGVVIHEHTADALARAPRIAVDSVPVATIEGSVDDAAADISTIIPQLFLADGRLVGRDRQRQVVVVFGADGTTRREFGRQGAGPGEYGFVGAIHASRDGALWVQDAKNSRISFLHPDSGAGAEYPLTEPLAVGMGNVAGAVADRLLVWGLSFPGAAKGAAGVATLKGGLFSPQQNTVRQLFITGPDREPEPAVKVNTGTGGAVMLVKAVAIPALQGFPAVFGWNGGLALTDGNRLRFELRDTTGSVTALIRFDWPRVAVSDKIWDAYISERLAVILGVGQGGVDGKVITAGGAPDTAAIRAKMRGQEHADSLPAYERIEVTTNGTLWVVDYRVPGEARWGATALAPDGRILGRLTGDSGGAPVAFGDDRVAFRSEDELGIATITVSRLLMP